MKLLVINAGSSSLKYQLFDMAKEEMLAKGLCQRIGIGGSKLEHKVGGKKIELNNDMPNHSVALKLVLETLVNKEYGVIESIDEIEGFGHRYVNGGDKYLTPVIITEKVLEDLENTIEFAPLHNPAHMMGIKACMSIAPNVKNVAVFDTGFFKDMPKKARLYPIKYELYEDLRVQRFGAHGTSHDYVSHEVAKEMGKDIKDLKIITCHIGNGASISAVKGGVAVDTSMGFTPLEGIMMGTRSGDVDPAIIPFVMKKLNISGEEVVNILNKESGLLGVSGISSDIRDILAQIDTNDRAKLAIDIFVYKIKKYIGSYAAAMGGVDAIVFTAGSGENRDDIRELIMQDMEFMGVDFDFAANTNFVRGVNFKISKPSSRVAVYVIPTEEELMIAKITQSLIQG
jgi:acetate kinase